MVAVACLPERATNSLEVGVSSGREATDDCRRGDVYFPERLSLPLAAVTGTLTPAVVTIATKHVIASVIFIVKATGAGYAPQMRPP